MTTRTTLTTSWQKIADAGSIHVTFDINGEAEYAFSDVLPGSGDDGHPVEGRATLTAQWDQDLYARIGGNDDSGAVYVDEATSSMGFGSGVSLVNVAQFVSVSV